MNELQIMIGTTIVNVRADSLSIADAIGERSTCQFVITGTRYYQGQPVFVFLGGAWDDTLLWDDALIWGNDELLFSGYVEKSTEKVERGTGVVAYLISCKDVHYLADKRIIAKAYENEAAGDIVTGIITDKLADEGVTVGTVSTGATIIEAVFNYITVTQALDSIAEKSGYIWYIDYDKKMYFIPRTTFASPWTADGTKMLSGSVQVENGAGTYRNTQYVRGSKDITDLLTENKIGDGVTKSWLLSFPCARVPTLTLNSSAVTVGIRGLETGKDYYWSKGSNVISQDDSGTVLTSSDDLEISYYGEFDVIVKTLDEAEIALRETLEDTSGIVEDVADENNSTTREAAFEIANSRLQKYCQDSRKLRFRTKESGLTSGQLLTVNLPEHDLTTDMLIESVTISTESNSVIWYDITCVEGPEQTSWVKVFETMATRGSTFVVRENINEDEVLITLKTFAKTWEAVDSPNIFTEVYAADDLYPAVDLFPMFAPTERVEYVELLDAGSNVLARNPIIKQTGTLNSIAYIAPYEGIGTIATVKWYGGRYATVANGSGVLIDTQSYAKVKTSLEALQIDKTDTRNFTPATGIIALDVDYIQGIDDDITALTQASA